MSKGLWSCVRAKVRENQPRHGIPVQCWQALNPCSPPNRSQQCRQLHQRQVFHCNASTTCGCEAPSTRGKSTTTDVYTTFASTSETSTDSTTSCRRLHLRQLLLHLLYVCCFEQMHYMHVRLETTQWQPTRQSAYL